MPLERDGALHQLEGLRLVFGRHGRVDIRTEDESVPPVGHRTSRIEPRRLGEGARRLGVIEAVREVHTLIDEQLRAG